MSVFGAINRFISRLDSDTSVQKSNVSHGAFGFRVLRNKNHEIPIEPWYDFVIGINGRQIDDPDPNLFATEVRNCAGSTVTLTLWNAKGQRLRDMHIPVPTPSPTLGITLQWTPLATTDDVWHVLDIIPDSPADSAGLLPYGDYIIGTPEGIVHGESGLGELVEDYLSRPLRLYVYNHEYAVTRLVTITPSRSWGGSGALGCVLGFGALHRLPVPLTEPPAAPGETLFETARLSGDTARSLTSSPLHPPPTTYPPAQSNDLLIPASMTIPPPLPTSPTPQRPGRKGRHVASPNRAFDEYFKEGEQKSREEDFVPTAKAAPPPPPPKLGVATHLPAPSLSAGVPRQTKSPDPELDEEEMRHDDATV
ncbi:hypothetical protein MMC34_005749 [Xylographa carneopallida]|nr:hypothetical protein [Xylographa carneopallida]